MDSEQDPAWLKFAYKFEFGPEFKKRISEGWTWAFDPTKLTLEGGLVEVKVTKDGRTATYSERFRPVEMYGVQVIVIKTI